MNRKSVTRGRRKNLLRLGTDFKEEPLVRFDDGTKMPKRMRGYWVEVTVESFKIYVSDRSRFNAMQAAWECAKWATTQIPKGEICVFVSKMHVYGGKKHDNRETGMGLLSGETVCKEEETNHTEVLRLPILP